MSNQPKLPKLPYLTIEEQWAILANKIFRVPPSTVQYEEMRKAFFCGYASGFQVISHVSSDRSEDEAVLYLDKLQKEIDEFETVIRKLAGERAAKQN